MDNNKNNLNYGQGEQQLRKRKFNESANDGQPAAAAGEEQKQQEPAENLSKKKCEHKQGIDDLEFEQLCREDLIKLVRKSANQAEEFSQRNVQLEQEKAEEVAEKDKQIDALLIQLNKYTSYQHQIPTDQDMKIQLSLETWYDWLAFVPHYRLGQIVPEIGDRKFASIVQKFLHHYGEITIGHIEIVAPYEEDPSGHPRVRRLQNNRPMRFEMADAQMPANIKNFSEFKLSYFDQSVLNFMQKFQQNGLLDNVNLSFGELSSKNIVQPVLCHILPLINGIVSIELEESAQLVDIYNAANSKEICEMNMKMMKETRILYASYDHENLDTKTIDLYCRWLYQTVRADGKPRVLQFGNLNMDSAPISVFIERIKKDFLMTTDPATFFIRIDLPKAFQPLEDICLDNGKTKEILLTKMEEAKLKEEEDVVLLISRYPLASSKKWIEENEKEVLAWDFNADTDADDDTRLIYLSKELKVVPI